ncbi:hypothetical protein [Micromonospora sp. NPDC050495]|uniref:hypothetical protein n=1 Tax=Micromonospora sp. NPDC050495 TaxID=3154936 RepID=UPI0033CA54F1
MSPDRLGAGSRPGHVNDNRAPGRPNVNNGPSPPPDNRNGSTTTAGTTAPSAARCNVVSTGFQPEPVRARTGTADATVVNDPSGFTNV